MDARWYDGRHVLVAGAGVSGATVTRTLLRIGAKVTVVDRKPNEELADLGAAVITEDGALPNPADDPLEWHGDFGAYAGAKSALWRSPVTTAVGNLDDERVAALLAQAPGPRMGFRLGVPGPGEFGVVEDLLVDRAFAPS